MKTKIYPLKGFLPCLCLLSAFAFSASAQVGPGKIAFDSTRQTNGYPQVYVMNADGSDQINLSANGFNDEMPVFNRFGTKLLYISDHLDGLGFRLCSMDADGSNQSTITTESGLGVQLLSYSLSPDGTKILYSGYAQPNNTAQFYTMNADGTGITLLGPGYHPIYSPDGRKIVFIRIGTAVVHPSDQFEFDLMEMNPDGTGLSALALAVYPSKPSFSPDGTRIAFTTYTPGSSSDTDISVMNADGTHPIVIATGGYSTATIASANYNPTFSADGTTVAFESNRAVPPPGVVEDLEIWSVKADGTGLTQLTFTTALSVGISWNRDPSFGPGAVGLPVLVGFSVAPGTVISGSSAQGTVTLSAPAPAGGAVVALASDSPDASVPLTVTVPAGATAASFPIATRTVGSVTVANITASYGLALSAALTLNPPDVLTITRDEYTISKQQLKLEATSTSLSATLKAYVTSSGALLGTLTNVGGGKYQLQTIWPVNPVNITLRSNLGGVVAGPVTPHN